MSRSLKAHILLVLITLIWGSNFAVIKNALADISPLFFNAVRMSLAAVVLAVIFYRELPRLTWASVRAGCLVGVFLFIGNELQTVGLQYTTPSKSAFLTGVSVVLVPVFLALFWKRAINRWTSVGVVLAFVGLVSADRARVSRRRAQSPQHESWRPAYPRGGRGVRLSNHFYRAHHPGASLAADHRGAGCDHRAC